MPCVRVSRTIAPLTLKDKIRGFVLSYKCPGAICWRPEPKDKDTEVRCHSRKRGKLLLLPLYCLCTAPLVIRRCYLYFFLWGLRESCFAVSTPGASCPGKDISLSFARIWAITRVRFQEYLSKDNPVEFVDLIRFGSVLRVAIVGRPA